MVQGRRCVLFAVVWLWVMCGTSFGGDNNTYMARPINWNPNKNMSLSLVWDLHAYTDTDFFDFWDIDSKPSNNFLPSCLGFEVKLGETLGLEIVAGYTGIDDDVSNRLEDADSVSIDLKTYCLLFSVKKYWQLTNALYLFGGIGGDVYYIDGELAYSTESQSYDLNYSRTVFGGHACIGAEYFFVKKMFPLSVDLQYKYALLQSVDVDQDLIAAINADTDSAYSSNDLNLSGHTVSLSLKIHF